MSTAHRIFRNSLLTTGSQIFVRIIDLATLIVLARILEPSSFGLVALAMSVILIIEAILELPIYYVLLAAGTSEPDALATGFTLALIRGGLLVGIAVAAGYVLGLLANDARVFPLVAVLSFGPFLRGLQSPKMVTFTLLQDFRRHAAVDLIGKFGAALVAIPVAIWTESYWALAVGVIGTPLGMVIASFCFAPFRPTFTLIRWQLFSRYLGFGIVAQTLRATSWQMDKIILAQFVTLGEVGKYTMALDIVSVPTKALVQPLSGPLHAGLASIDKGATSTIGRAYLKSTVAILTLIGPIFLYLGFFSETIIVTVLGSKWQASAFAVAWLSGVAFLTLPQTVLGPVLVTIGRPELAVPMAAIELFIKAAGMFWLIPLVGIEGAIMAQGISALCMTVGTFYLAKTVVRVGYGEQITALFPPVLAAVILAAFFTGLNALQIGVILDSKVAPLVCGVIVGIPIYCVAIGVLWHLGGRPDGIVSMAFRQFRKN